MIIFYHFVMIFDDNIISLQYQSINIGSKIIKKNSNDGNESDKNHTITQV